MHWFSALFVALIAATANADAIVAVKTIRANTVLTANDVAVNTGLPSYGLDAVSEVIGLETRVVLYAGRAIRPEHQIG